MHGTLLIIHSIAFQCHIHYITMVELYSRINIYIYTQHNDSLNDFNHLYHSTFTHIYVLILSPFPNNHILQTYYFHFTSFIYYP